MECVVINQLGPRIENMIEPASQSLNQLRNGSHIVYLFDEFKRKTTVCILTCNLTCNLTLTRCEYPCPPLV